MPKTAERENYLKQKTCTRTIRGAYSSVRRNVDLNRGLACTGTSAETRQRRHTFFGLENSNGLINRIQLCHLLDTEKCANTRYANVRADWIRTFRSVGIPIPTVRVTIRSISQDRYFTSRIYRHGMCDKIILQTSSNRVFVIPKENKRLEKWWSNGKNVFHALTQHRNSVTFRNHSPVQLPVPCFTDSREN